MCVRVRTHEQAHGSVGDECIWRCRDLLSQASLVDAIPFLPTWDLRKQHGRPGVNILGVFPLFLSPPIINFNFIRKEAK